MENPFGEMARRKHGVADFPERRSVRLLRKKGKGGKARAAACPVWQYPLKHARE
jgi:hypothetical protein